MKLDTQVVVIGTGPVGMVLAMELKSRGVDVIMIEKRTLEERAGDMSMARCNTVASRTMEIFRHLGVAGAVRAAGLPDDYPTDVAWLTRANGHEIARLSLPSRSALPGDTESLIANWPTAEPVHRASQLLLDPILFDHLREHWGIEVRSGTEYLSYREVGDHVAVTVRAAGSDEPYELQCRYLVGCDGGRSAVRKQIGAKLAGDDELYRSRVVLLRAPWMRQHFQTPLAWMNNYLGPGPLGFMISVNGDDLWLLHLYLPTGETDFDTIDTDRDIRSILQLPPELSYEIVHQEDWIARRLIADRFRKANVFICGDAAHLWPPFGGHGMNAGIADANNLGWLIASVVQGWGDPAILDCYEAERLPVTEQVSRFAMDKVLAFKKANGDRRLPPDFDRDTPAGAAARAEASERILRVHAPQYATKGLNYAFFYDHSPIIAYDDETAPSYDMGTYTPSTVPGCRAPHLFLPDGRSLYDLLADGYALLRFDPGVAVYGLIEAADARGIPFRVIDLPRPAEPAFRHKLVLVRPDQQVAWRGDALPPDPYWLVDLVRGALIGTLLQDEPAVARASC
ncbi:MAG: cadA [Bradyrhizobium sp.]|nr:cadA [Bradyrhizobium sp.]